MMLTELIPVLQRLLKEEGDMPVGAGVHCGSEDKEHANHFTSAEARAVAIMETDDGSLMLNVLAFPGEVPDALRRQFKVVPKATDETLPNC